MSPVDCWLLTRVYIMEPCRSALSKEKKEWEF